MYAAIIHGEYVYLHSLFSWAAACVFSIYLRAICNWHTNDEAIGSTWFGKIVYIACDVQ